MAKKKKNNTKVHKTIKCLTEANIGKIVKTNELLKPFRNTLSCIISNLDKDYLQGKEIALFSTYTKEYLKSELSARQIQTSYTQATESFKSWIALLEVEVRKIIRESKLDEFSKITLFRLNSNNLYYSKDNITFLWKVEGNRLLPCDKKASNYIEMKVDDCYFTLIRKIIKQAKKRISRPNLNRVTTLKLDAKVAQLLESNNSFQYWVKLSTMELRKPIEIPLKNNPYLNEIRKQGKLLNYIQLKIEEDKLFISPIIESEVKPKRKEGSVIGLDWGLSSLFTTSNGDFLGRKMLQDLKSMDAFVTEYSAQLQQDGIKLKDDKTYVEIQRKINSYVKNEVGRLFNKLNTDDLKEIVVEKLDFRGKGLSKQMNRLLTRAGRSVVKAKLKRLEEEGLTITYVNSAYTSQECSSCGFVHKSNRKNQKEFKCKCCGYKSNADINAAKNIMERRSFRYSVDSSSATVRKNLFDVLSKRHELSCSSGKHRTTVRNIGLTEQPCC